MEKQNIYFISGHRDIKISDFEKTYVPALIRAISEPGSKFVVADYEGVDSMAQDWLKSNLPDHSRVTVYHMNDKPMYLASDQFNTVGGFTDDISRDSAMTDTSTSDIAFIYPGRWTSGTAQNILRRYEKL